MTNNTQYPIFRLIHQSEAEHHSRIVCRKKGLRKNSKQYKLQFEKSFYKYIHDAQESLYPSGEITPPTKSNPRSKLTKAKILIPEARQPKNEYKTIRYKVGKDFYNSYKVPVEETYYPPNSYHPVFKYLNQPQIDLLASQPEYDVITDIMMLHHLYGQEFDKHLTDFRDTGNGPTDLEKKNMKSIYNKLVRILRKDDSIDDPKYYAKEILQISKSQMENRVRFVQIELVKILFSLLIPMPR